MNYYPFHIGDYASATQHLSLEEDCMYRRLLDLAYTSEKPLPLDELKISRLARCATDQHREAVQVVLQEFFSQGPEGWTSKRVEAELTEMRLKQVVTQERNEHEKTRMQKHRERRSIMFAQLAELGIYPPFNAKTGELQHLLQIKVQPHVTQLVTPSVTPALTLAKANGYANGDGSGDALVMPPAVAGDALATAIPIPTPTPTPTPKVINTISPEVLTHSEPPALLTNFAIPLNDGTEYRVPVQDLAEWEKAYLAVDVRQELREMRTWSLANKANRKTRTGVGRFIVRWLAKAQDTPKSARNFTQNGGASGNAWDGAK